MKKPSPAVQYLGRVLVGAVESIARGLAKGAESVAKDAETALKNEASKVKRVGQTVEAWRRVNLGEIEETEKEGMQ